MAPIGVYPETKHPSHFASIGLRLEPLLLESLKAGLGNAPVFIQSFEVGNLRYLRRQCDYPLVQLLAAEGAPWDQSPEKGGNFANLASAEGLKKVSDYADAIGVQKTMVLAEGAGGVLTPTRLVDDAHAVGLEVHAWTFRAENMFLPVTFRRGTDLAGHGDLAGEIRLHVETGVDGLFCDHPDVARGVLPRPATRGPGA
jgi:glycerophosphoryl diester phosphodiesterase